MAQPLTKTKEDDGTLYTRPPPIEAAIDIALGQNLDTLRQRARVRDRKDPLYLPSECLVHLTRRAIRTGDGAAYNTLLPLLLERCKANLNKYVVASVPNAALLRETILCDFAALFAIDGTEDDKLALDIFECRFNFGFMRFRQTRVTKVLEQERRDVELPSDEGETAEGEISHEVLARLADLRGDGNPEDRLFSRQMRQQLIRALWELPANERKAVLLVHYYGLQIAAEDDPSKVTAASLCGVTRRTIQNWLARGLAKLSKLRELA